jgi:hypothetical protein
LQKIRELEVLGQKSDLRRAAGLYAIFEAQLNEVLTSIRRGFDINDDTQMVSGESKAGQ